MTRDRWTDSLAVPGAVLAFDVLSGGPRRPLLVFGSPMSAAGFASLAGQFVDRTVITYDPRGVDRSERTDPSDQSTPQQHAADLSALLAHLDLGPADVFASSGGAINALELVARHPQQVATLVAHEPPCVAVLPDRDEALEACATIRRIYLESGFGPALARFIALTMHVGPVPRGFADAPVDPAQFGLPTDDDGTRNDALLRQNLVTSTSYEPDTAALRDASTRIVLAVGEASQGHLAYRAGVRIAELLDRDAIEFPGGHGGFMGGEYAQMGEPVAFAAALRAVLTD